MYAQPKDRDPVLLIAVVLVLLVVLAVVMGGCKWQPDILNPSAVNPAPTIAEVQANIDAAKGSIDDAKSKLERNPPEVPKAIADLDEAKKQLGAATAANAELRGQVEVLVKDNGKIIASYDELKAKWEAMQDDWIGPRAWGYIQWIIGLSIAAWVLSGVTAALLPGTGIAKLLVRNMPLMSAFTWLREKVGGKQATQSTVTVNVVGGVK